MCVSTCQHRGVHCKPAEVYWYASNHHHGSWWCQHGACVIVTTAEDMVTTAEQAWRNEWCVLLQADPMQQSWDKRTPLHFAAQHRHPTVIRQLLLHPSLRQNPTSALQHPSGFALQYRPIQPELQQHPQALDTGGHQAQNISEAVLPKSPLPVHEPQIEIQNSKPAKADLVSGHASVQNAASSLQSLHSGIQYEPYVAGTISRQEPDTTSNSSIDGAEELDYTGEDAHAMEALLALTSDCSVQSPSQSHNPAGKGSCEASHCFGHTHIYPVCGPTSNGSVSSVYIKEVCDKKWSFSPKHGCKLSTAQLQAAVT